MLYDENNFGENKKGSGKGFYYAACVALVCLLAVGTVYYRQVDTSQSDQENQLASESVSTPAVNDVMSRNKAADNTGSSAIQDKQDSSKKKNQKNEVSGAQKKIRQKIQVINKRFRVKTTKKQTIKQINKMIVVWQL